MASNPKPSKKTGIRNSFRSNGKAWKQSHLTEPPIEQSEEDSRKSALRRQTRINRRK